MKDKKKQQGAQESGPKVDRATLAKFSRGSGLSAKDIKAAKDKKTKGYLHKNEEKIKAAALLATKAKILQVEEPGYIEAEGLEKTWKFKQEDIIKQVPLASAYKSFDLKLDFGPYALDYGRSGRNLLIGGSKGHVAAFDWKTGKLLCETQLKETVHAVKWLHQESFYAVAQKKHTYIYDINGLEVHALRKHEDVTLLDFLPFHMLLVSSGKYGSLRYQDVSTGDMVTEQRTKLGATYSMRQNPTNAIMHLGHSSGTVTLWSPNLSTPLVKMLCHKGPVQSLAVDRSGRYMVTSGLNAQLKTWDLRMYKMLQEYYTPLAATSVDISQLGLLAVTFGATVNIWKDVFMTKQNAPYLSHRVEGSLIGTARFCPFDDVLGLGHTRGLSSMLVPGAGEPNFDSFEANPFQTKKQRQEATVKSLLDKIQPDTIALDTEYIGQLKVNQADVVEHVRSQSRQANASKDTLTEPSPLTETVAHETRKSRGRGSTLRRYLNKQQNVVDARKQTIVAQLEMKKQAKSGMTQPKSRSALDRFKPKTGKD